MVEIHEKTGLWKRESQNHRTYQSGKVIINGIEIGIRLFDNQNKASDKSPDSQIYFDTIVREPKESEPHEPEEKKEDIFTLSDDDLPF